MRVNGENVPRGASRQASKPSLLIAMIKAVGVPFAAAGFLRIISDLLTFVGPQVLKYEKAFLSKQTVCFVMFYRLLIEYIKDENEPAWKGYLYAVLLFVPAIIQSLAYQHYFHWCFVVGMHLRTAIISIIYNKVTFWWIWLRNSIVAV